MVAAAVEVEVMKRSTDGGAGSEDEPPLTAETV